MTQNVSNPKWPRYLRRSEAARYLREEWGWRGTAGTRAKIAALTNEGPKMPSAGRIPLSPPRSLDQYALQNIGPARRSTFETGKAAGLIAPRRYRRGDHGATS